MNRSISQRIYWRLLRLFGFEQLAWDKQFEAGVWSIGERSPYTIERVVELAKGGRIVEFGCGEALLAGFLPKGSFSDYYGYDISRVAIDRAEARLKKNNQTNCHVECSDMAAWQGVDSISLVLLEECLYYLTLPQIETFLARCCQCLTENGSILVVVHSAVKHARTLDACRRACSVKDESTSGSRTYLTLTPRNVPEFNALRAS